MDNSNNPNDPNNPNAGSTGFSWPTTPGTGLTQPDPSATVPDLASPQPLDPSQNPPSLNHLDPPPTSPPISDLPPQAGFPPPSPSAPDPAPISLDQNGTPTPMEPTTTPADPLNNPVAQNPLPTSSWPPPQAGDVPASSTLNDPLAAAPSIPAIPVDPLPNPLDPSAQTPPAFPTPNIFGATPPTTGSIDGAAELNSPIHDANTTPLATNTSQAQQQTSPWSNPTASLDGLPQDNIPEGSSQPLSPSLNHALGITSTPPATADTPPAPPTTPPTETAPTDLSHLITENNGTGNHNDVYNPPLAQAENLVVPQSNNAVPETVNTTNNHFNLSKMLIIVGIVVVLIVSGLSAYFILGIGKPAPEPASTPAVEDSTLTNPPTIATPQPIPVTPTPSAQIQLPPVPTPSPKGSSAIDLLKQRQTPSTSSSLPVTP